jgi:septum site-determining protein MinC
MSTSTANTVLQPAFQLPSFQLKGSLFTLSVLQLNDPNLQRLKAELNEKIRLAPQFFQHAPVVLDLNQLNSEALQSGLDFEALREMLRSVNLVPVGIRGGNQSLHQSAQKAGFAIMLDPAPSQSKITIKASDIRHESHTAKKKPDIREHSSDIGSRLITTPIRSGQQVYAQGGDLIIAASVSPGAELLADGNIHVYGTLRGRALAGINGNENARIFCYGLEAELVSIAGQYKVFEEHTDVHHGPKQLFLREGQLIISPFKF